jgi:hypothetical protein
MLNAEVNAEFFQYSAFRIAKVPPQRAVSRILFPGLAAGTTIIPLAPSLLMGSSGLPGGFGRAVLITPPYLALLRAGFCLPPVLPRARCALTAPFHPYLPSRLSAPRQAVCFLCHFPSGCPDRALPGALPCGVRTFLSPSRPPGATPQQARRGLSRAPWRACRAEASEGREGGRSSGLLRRLSVSFLSDAVLLQLLVQVAARRSDNFGGL